MDNFRNGTQPSKDMTQRVPMNSTPRPSSPQRKRRKKWYMTTKEKVTLITLGSVTIALLLFAIFAIFGSFNALPDDGRILKGVYAAGVNLGGMTKEEAAVALDKATANTYSKLDMVVSVLDTQIALSPSDTGAALNIRAVVEAAYSYGRTGSRTEQEQARENAKNNSSVIIPITSHLNLNTDYIREQVNTLGRQFSSTLTQAKLTLTGTKPQMNIAKPDTGKVHQTLKIYVGTPEYGLDTNKLYNQVLEHYNINIFQVAGACTVKAPDSIEEELLAYYNDLCVEPVDAQMDPVTYEVTPEKYGYGFNLNTVKEQIAKTPYGETLTIHLRYLEPNLTEELIASNLFKDVIGEDTAQLGIDEAWNTNVDIACKTLNGLILKSGDTLSFNQVLGDLTADKGYLEALAYLDRVKAPTIGGGVSHVASVLYTSALEAELEITERHSHAYIPDFISEGRDAYVDGVKDLKIRNNRPDPIRIRAEVVDGVLHISIDGTDNRNYTAEITVKVTDTILPGKLYNNMVFGNPGGHYEGQVLVEGLNGCVIEVYKAMYSKETGELQIETFLTTYSYEARDAIVVKLQAAVA